jgi:hypothetical protein
VLGSVAEDSGAALEHNASAADFAQALNQARATPCLAQKSGQLQPFTAAFKERMGQLTLCGPT